MTYQYISPVNIFVQSISLLFVACFILKIIEGQSDEWPVVIDPFPDADVIGPEPFPTPAPAPDCSFACQERIDEAERRISFLETQLRDTNFSLSSRISELERNNNGGGGNNNGELSLRISQLENTLASNMSNIMAKINSDINQLRTQLSDDIAYLRRELEAKINALLAGGGGGDSSGKAMEVYFNLTNRITSLENGKIQMLLSDNNLWRQNFRVVNATFSKLRKSNNGNNVILTG